MDNHQKDHKIVSLFINSIKLDVEKGHLKWTISSLAKSSKITRSLIYHYFEGDKERILDEALHYLGNVLVGAEDKQLNYWRDHNIHQALKNSRSLLKECPQILQFYFKYRSSIQYGKKIRSMELKGIKKRQNFLKVSFSEAKVLFYLQMGLGIAPNLKAQEISMGLKKLGLSQQFS
ncbi:TetR/AcrR family transcriptional regulator [Bacteriovoracaceae bacterium]|nr:TetR/AcrR family transcriptional regulator [Bacteriovoracaceae bacterium]